jgi:hypothetical protein
MNEQAIRALVQQEIKAHSSSARFGLNSIPRHIHNNVDSPFVFQPLLTYIGFVNYDGTSLFLPKGWTINYDGGSPGAYAITHNLSTSNYAAIACAQQSTNTVVDVVISQFSSSIEFDWFSAGAVAPADTSFTFIISLLNNSQQTNPLYTVT